MNDAEKELVQRAKDAYPTMPIRGVDEPICQAPKKKEWMGLTDEEINVIGLANGFGRGSIRLSQTINAIEVRLKEKNNG